MKDISILFQQIEKIKELAEGFSCPDSVDPPINAVSVDALEKYQRELLPIPLRTFHYPQAGQWVSVFEYHERITFRIHVFIKDINHQFGWNIEIKRGASEQDVSFITENEKKKFSHFMDKELKDKFPLYNR